MTSNACGFIILLLLAVGVTLFAYLLLRNSLRTLLNTTVKLPACTTFYTRLLVIGLTFIALSGALKTSFDLETGAAFMEYVWKVADGLSSAFGNMGLFLTGYLFVITILVATLRRGRE